MNAIFFAIQLMELIVRRWLAPLQAAQSLVRLLEDKAIPLLAGSDTGVHPLGAGEAFMAELQVLESAGLTPHQVLRAATYTPRLTWQPGGLPASWIGSQADLVLYSENPFDNLAALQNPQEVILNGLTVFSISHQVQP